MHPSQQLFEVVVPSFLFFLMVRECIVVFCEKTNIVFPPQNCFQMEILCVRISKLEPCDSCPLPPAHPFHCHQSHCSRLQVCAQLLFLLSELLVSQAWSRWNTTSRATSICSFLFPMVDVFQTLRGFAVLCSLVSMILIGSLVSTWADHASQTTAWQPNMRGQKFFNLNHLGGRLCTLPDINKGQWSDIKDDSGHRRQSKKRYSQQRLQKPSRSAQELGCIVHLTR